MAHIKHNHFLDTVDSVFNHAKECKILHLKAEGDTFDGRCIEIEGEKLYHFGTTGYLGLEQDKRLKLGAIKAYVKLTTHFLMDELETQWG